MNAFLITVPSKILIKKKKKNSCTSIISSGVLYISLKSFDASFDFSLYLTGGECLVSKNRFNVMNERKGDEKKGLRTTIECLYFDCLEFTCIVYVFWFMKAFGNIFSVL